MRDVGLIRLEGGLIRGEEMGALNIESKLNLGTYLVGQVKLLSYHVRRPR